MTNYVLAFKPTMLGNHDHSACLMADGQIIAAAEEERFCRIKHAVQCFPHQAIRFCLDSAGIELDDLAAIGIPYDPKLFYKALDRFRDNLVKSRGFLDGYYQLGVAINKLTFPYWGRGRLWDLLDPDSKSKRRVPISYISHHLCHAASAYYCSGIEEASIITIDGVGEYDSTVLWHAKDGDLTRLRTFKNPNSLGLFYSLFTDFLGFQSMDGEGKVMALAPYGDPNAGIGLFLNNYTDISSGSYSVSHLIRELAVGNKLEMVTGIPRRKPTDEILVEHKSIAWHVQDYIERALVELVRDNHLRTGSRNVCLAGGVALNCMANKKVMELDCVDDLFIQPVAHDSGLAIGCGQIVSKELGHDPMSKLEHVYLGPDYCDSEVEATLKRFKLSYEKVDDASRVAAEALAAGEFVGWFQGRMEMGPRALGNRSILADPRSLGTSERLNRDVKRREIWRPFAPSVLKHRAPDWFSNCVNSPFMIKAFETIAGRWSEIEGVVHPVDKTARVQTVSLATNTAYYRLIEEFDRLTGIPMVLNTSFNLAGEPIVCKPEEAIIDFFRSGLDNLVIGSFILRKRNHHSHQWQLPE